MWFLSIQKTSEFKAERLISTVGKYHNQQQMLSIWFQMHDIFAVQGQKIEPSSCNFKLKADLDVIYADLERLWHLQQHF